jgi:hypothetical protein
MSCLYSPSCREEAFSEIRQDKRGNLPNGYAPQEDKSEPIPPPTGPQGSLFKLIHSTYKDANTCIVRLTAVVYGG